MTDQTVSKTMGGYKLDRYHKFLFPLGMTGVLFYFAHTILGNLLWPEYNPITMDISSLTADGAPDAELLRILSLIYSICMILFALSLVYQAAKNENRVLRTGFIVLLIMQITSAAGYGLFPLTGDKTEMNFQNTMHIVVTVIVVFTTIASSFLIAKGYLKRESTRKLGRISLVFAVLITITGVFNPISMALQLNVLGLSERLVIYTIQIFMFVLSFYYTFLHRENGVRYGYAKVQ